MGYEGKGCERRSGEGESEDSSDGKCDELNNLAMINMKMLLVDLKHEAEMHEDKKETGMPIARHNNHV